MKAPPHNLALLKRVVDALGAESRRVVVVGATAAATYALGPAAPDIRVTDDVDLVVELITKAQYDTFINQLRVRGASRDVESSLNAPLCRYRIGNVLTDVMPVDAGPLGFTNRWYAEAVARSRSHEFGDGTSVRVIAPLDFVATKITAFQCPTRVGHGDLLASHDIEDVLTVLIGLPDAVHDVAVGTEAVHEFVRSSFREFLQRREFYDVVGSQFPLEIQTEARKTFWRRLAAMSTGTLMGHE
jgi:hypothetical protein